MDRCGVCAFYNYGKKSKQRRYFVTRVGVFVVENPCRLIECQCRVCVGSLLEPLSFGFATAEPI